MKRIAVILGLVSLGTLAIAFATIGACADNLRAMNGASADALQGNETRSDVPGYYAPRGGFQAHKDLKSFGYGPSPDDDARVAPAIETGLPMDADEVWIIERSPNAGPVAQRPRYGSGELLATPGGTRKQVPLPLAHTGVHARISAYVASVRVDQRYENPFDTKIEAVYVFPLPQNAAVSDFVMVIGKRKIRGIIRERKEAERLYALAKQQGYTASLLTQERPNVFTQKVANIDPGHAIDVQITYYDTLPYRDGGYDLVFPMVVGPRFNPVNTRRGIGAVARGHAAASSQPTAVSYLAPNETGKNRVSLTVDLDAGVPIERVWSPTHPIQTTWLSDSRRTITLAGGDAVPNKDFELRYQVAGKRIRSAFLVDHEAGGSYFTYVLDPPASLSDTTRAPVEMVFVLDCSGSMSGGPLDAAKRAVRSVLARLSPRDTFQIIRFSDGASSFGPRPVTATPAHVRRALAYLASLSGMGGTEMLGGIEAALDFPHDPSRLRLVSFMTDGYIGNESEILRAVHDHLGDARIFSFGVGSSPNRYLLDRMARLGRGAAAYVGMGDDADLAAVDDFYQRVAHPALSDISIDWGSMKVSEVYPSRIPDLFVGRPVVLTGRLDGDAGGSITVHGRVGGREVALSREVHVEGATTRPALAKIWARRKIRDLARRAFYAKDETDVSGTMKEVALRYGLLSSFTAFVAVDAAHQGAPGVGVRVHQAVPVPAGVRYQTTVQGG